MKKRNLRLNSLARYSKQSPNLVLEEHDHCEVPAGCGGVVLRWRNPHAGTPVEFWLASSGPVEVRLDGKRVRAGRPIVPPGDHVLAFVTSDVLPRSGLISFAAIYNEDKATHTAMSRKTGVSVSVLSVADGSWKYSAIDPGGDSWMHPGFDDAAWLAMQRFDFPRTDAKDSDRYRKERVRELGAEPLGVTDAATRVWIRKAFNLPKP